MEIKSKFVEIKEDLEDQILMGKIKIGDSFPTEEELAGFYGVSRATVRQALSAFLPLLERRPRLGTILKEPLPKKAGFESMHQQLRNLNLTPSVRLLEKKLCRADEVDEKISTALGVDRSTTGECSICHLERLFLGSGAPLIHQITYLNRADFGDFMDVEISESIFSYYSQFGRRVLTADEAIRARRATPRESELLDLGAPPPADPWVMERFRVSYDRKGRVLEVLQSVEPIGLFGSYNYRIEESNLPTFRGS